MAPSLTETIFSISASVLGTDPPVKAPERVPDGDERAVLARVAEILRVTVLEPFQSLRMPVTSGRVHRSSTINAAEWRDSCDRLIIKIAQYISRLPLLLSCPPNLPATSPAAAVFQATAARLAGRPFEAYTILHQVMKDDPAPAILMHLYQLDTQRELGIQRVDLHPPPSLDSLLSALEHVNLTILLLSEAEELLVGDVTDAFELATSGSATDLMLHGPLESHTFQELYATIVYCDILAVCYRYSCLTDNPIHQRLSRVSDEAAERLMEISETLKAPGAVEQAMFLRWRCGNAIRECFPFASTTARPTHQHGAWPLGDSFEDRQRSMVEIVRFMETKSYTLTSLTTRLHTHLDDLISRHDLRGIDELLFALQLCRDHNIEYLQKQLRTSTWEMHARLFPRAPWALDCWLLHPVSLWIGAEYRRGRAQATSWYRRYERQPSLGIGRRVDASPQLARLQIGLGPLGDDLSDSLRFVYAWSILHSCLLYTPAPFEDRLYRLLFVDHDQFSYSQLGLRLRQVCRYRLAGEVSTQHISLDGFSEPHRHIAGLDSLDLGHDRLEKIGNLCRELTELSLLKQELRRLEGAIGEPLKRQGLRHLIGTITVYEGDAHLQMAEQHSQLLDEAHRARSPVLPKMETSTIEEDLRDAKRAYEEAFYGYRDAQYGEITRQGGEGMIKVQQTLCDRFTHSKSSETAQRPTTESTMQLYHQLQEPLRSRLVQAYGTPSYRYACRGAKGPVSIATGPGDLPSGLYDAGQRILSSVGKPQEAFLWLAGGSDDIMLGAEMLMLREAGTETAHPMAIDIPMTLSSSMTPSLRGFMKRVGQNVAALWKKTDHDHASDESTSSSVSAVMSLLKPEINNAVLVQWSLNANGTVRCHIARGDGSIFEKDCNITYDSVRAMKAEFYKTVWSNPRDLRRRLDPLVTHISDLTTPDDLIILIPGPVCGGVLLHVLQAGSKLALYDSNAVSYVPGLRSLEQCVGRARRASRETSRPLRTTAVGVWERPPQNMQAIQTQIHSLVDTLAKAMGGNSLKGSAATYKAFQDAVRDSECLYFIGHGNGGDEEGTPPRLVLHGKDRFSASDLLKIGLPGSLVVLFGCSTAKFRQFQNKERFNMSSACLAAGGVAVLGSMISIYTDASRELALTVTMELGTARIKHTPGRLYNIAEGFRLGLKEARKGIDVQKRKGPKITEDQLWGAFVHVGSPLIAVDDLVLSPQTGCA